MAKDREVLDGESGAVDIPEEPIETAKKGQRLLHTRKVRIKGADGATKSRDNSTHRAHLHLAGRVSDQIDIPFVRKFITVTI